MAEFGLQMPQMPDFTFQAPDVGGMALDGFYAAQDNVRANQNAGLLQNADRRQDVRLGMDQQDAAMRQTQFTQEQQDRVAMITRAKEAQAAFAEFYDKIDDGTASAADIAQLTAAYPELSESVKQTMDGLAQEQKATYSGLIFQSASALKLGKPEMAAKLFEDYAAAAENSGQTDVAALSRAMAETARQDPAAALGTLGVFAQSLDPEINTAVFGEGKAEGPLSPQGKLKADLDAGRITQAQFDEASKPSQPLVNVNTGGGSEKQIFDAIKESADIARSAVSGLNALQEAEKAIAGGAITGFGANTRLSAAKLGALVGVTDPEIIQNTETFRSAIAPQVAAMIKATVGTTQISNTDREFAEKATGGDISLDEGTISRLLDIMTRASSAVASAHAKRLDAVYPEGQGFDRERALFALPSIPSGAAGGSGLQSGQLDPVAAAAADAAKY
jgi:hypothetical protein